MNLEYFKVLRWRRKISNKIQRVSVRSDRFNFELLRQFIILFSSRTRVGLRLPNIIYIDRHTLFISAILSRFEIESPNPTRPVRSLRRSEELENVSILSD